MNKILRAQGVSEPISRALWSSGPWYPLDPLEIRVHARSTVCRVALDAHACWWTRPCGRLAGTWWTGNRGLRCTVLHRQIRPPASSRTDHTWDQLEAQRQDWGVEVTHTTRRLLHPKGHVVLSQTTAQSREVTMPSRAVTMPTREVMMPTREVTMPTREVTMPSRAVTMPTREVTMPTREVTMPSRAVTMPTREVTMLTREVTMPTREVTMPTREVTMPSRAVTMPTREVTMPSREVTMPSRAVTMPSHAVTMPTREVIIIVLCCIQKIQILNSSSYWKQSFALQESCIKLLHWLTIIFFISVSNLVIVSCTESTYPRATALSSASWLWARCSQWWRRRRRWRRPPSHRLSWRRRPPEPT